MKIKEIEEIRTLTNQIAEKLTPHPSSILKVEFKKFYEELDKTLATAVVTAYKNGELSFVPKESKPEAGQ